jgi:hypothetical protein
MDCEVPHDVDGDQVKVAHERKPSVLYGVRILGMGQKPLFFLLGCWLAACRFRSLASCECDEARAGALAAADWAPGAGGGPCQRLRIVSGP